MKTAFTRGALISHHYLTQWSNCTLALVLSEWQVVDSNLQGVAVGGRENTGMHTRNSPHISKNVLQIFSDSLFFVCALYSSGTIHLQRGYPPGNSVGNFFSRKSFPLLALYMSITPALGSHSILRQCVYSAALSSFFRSSVACCCLILYATLLLTIPDLVPV
jgi:hypothetical protein